MGWSICQLVCAGNISCKDPTERGCHEGVYPSEDNVGRSIVAPAFFPPINNSLVITVHYERCAGAVESEQGMNE